MNPPEPVLAPVRSVESLENMTRRSSVRIRTAQSMRALPVVAITLVVLQLGLADRVEAFQFHLWMVLLVISTLTRARVCQIVARKVDTASPADLDSAEVLLWASLVFNTAVLGACFWLVAANGDLTAKFVMTLVSCFYGVGSLVNASNHFPSFAAGVVLNLGQGILFWLGIGSDNPMQLEVAVPYAAVALLMLGFGKENAAQFRESLRIRLQNVTLLEQIEKEKRTVENALDEVRQTSESKSRFLAAASHDLRQPLHAMTMFIGTLRFHVSSEEGKRLLQRITDTSHVLEDQFNSLLDLSRFEVNAVVPDPGHFRLDLLVDELLSEFEEQAHAKQLALSAVTCEAPAWSDRMLVEQVLRNLIANAVKYTISGSVVVRVEQLKGEFFVEVIDTGSGIAPAEQSRIFEEYVQLANPARQRRYGVGLGLAIVKRIDSLLDLRLQLRSAEGLGSRFGFFVPTAAADSIQSEVLGKRMASTSFRTSDTVWLLDDEPDVLEGLASQLGVWGAEVKTFSEPETLLLQLCSGEPGPRWVFADDMLGSPLSGLETAQMITQQLPNCRVCIVTGNTEPGRLAQLRTSGFPVIVKPARPEVLVAFMTAG